MHWDFSKILKFEFSMSKQKMEITDSTIKYISLYIVRNYAPFGSEIVFQWKKCKLHFFDLKRLKSTLNPIFGTKNRWLFLKKNISDKKIDDFFWWKIDDLYGKNWNPLKESKTQKKKSPEALIKDTPLF